MDGGKDVWRRDGCMDGTRCGVMDRREREKESGRERRKMREGKEKRRKKR